ncbi:hypothetical protein BH09GEM1_BH09GEM1_07610 [soil metagenome]
MRGRQITICRTGHSTGALSLAACARTAHPEVAAGGWALRAPARAVAVKDCASPCGKRSHGHTPRTARERAGRGSEKTDGGVVCPRTLDLSLPLACRDVSFAAGEDECGVDRGPGWPACRRSAAERPGSSECMQRPRNRTSSFSRSDGASRSPLAHGSRQRLTRVTRIPMSRRGRSESPRRIINSRKNLTVRYSRPYVRGQARQLLGTGAIHRRKEPYRPHTPVGETSVSTSEGHNGGAQGRAEREDRA